MLQTAFRKYDIRGRVGTELNINDIYNLARTLAYILTSPTYNCKRVVIGMDGRTHSPGIKDELIRGLTDAGLDVIFIGCVPSPVCYFAHEVLGTDASLMITASHNTKEYNGIKMAVGSHLFFDHDITVLQLMYSNGIHRQLPLRKGTLATIDILDRYIQRLRSEFTSLANCTLPLVIDCTNASVGPIISRLVSTFNFTNTQLLFAEVNGEFPNHEPDPTKAKNITQLTQNCIDNQAIGIAFDGDADRMAAVTEHGQHLVGDDLSALFCKDMYDTSGNLTAVLEIKCAVTLVNWLRALGVTVHQTPCGHSFVVKAMQQHNALFGGELSCHYCFSDRYYGYDDGIYAALRLIEIINKHSTTLHQLSLTLPERHLSAEMRIPCPEQHKDRVVAAMIDFAHSIPDYQVITLDGLCVIAPQYAGTIRKSNTEPVLSVRFEGTTPENLRTIAQQFHQQLLRHLEPAVIQPFFEHYT